MKHTIKIASAVVIIILLLCTATSCKKFLDKKSDQKLALPNTLGDLQALLDHYTVVSFSDPSAGEISADDIFVFSADAGSPPLSQDDARKYIWEKDYLFTSSVNDWGRSYQRVYIANTVLENIENIERTAANAEEWDNIRGQALFLRGKNFLNLVLLFANAYDSTTSANDAGIPLRLNTNFDEVSVRASVQQTYDQLISDLNESIRLLKITPVHVMRSSRPAAYALLARAYLSMRKYNLAGLYADSCLQRKNTLLNYNDGNINTNTNQPAFGSSLLGYNNPEIIHEARTNTSAILSSYSKVDSTLYPQYAAADKRKTVFFRNITSGNRTYQIFRGSYEGTNDLCSAITTSEVYLMRAECYARAGNVTAAMNDLNRLMRARWTSNVTYTDTVAANADAALTKILVERRKELVLRAGLRWMDLKRLNKEGRNITIRRFVNNQLFELKPNELRYALPIPEDVIVMSGMTQNPR
jgi:hypothetical protein